MAKPLPLDEMTVEEKLQAMESIWDDLCRHAESIPSPPWHEEVLSDREAAIERGDAEFEDWESAKKRINGDLS